MGVSGLAVVAESTHYSLSRHENGLADSAGVEPGGTCEAFFRRLVVTPGSWSNFTWESIGGMHIAYDLLMIPLTSFELPEALVFRLADWSTTLYWSADLPYQFFVSYEDLGLIEKNPKVVALHYLKTWFVVDLLVVIMDWFILFTGLYAGASRSWRTGKFVKAFRILRAVRLIRIIKFMKVLTEAIDKASSLRMVIYLKVTYLMMGVILAAHYCGCYWYYVTTFDAATSWVQESKLEGASVGLLYIHSLYWALAQSGFGVVNMYPTNEAERIYASGVSVTWLLLVMTCLSSLTVWALQLRDVSIQQEMQEAGVRTYLAERQINTSVRHGVLRFYRLYRRKLLRRQHAADIPLFDNLPVFLRMELYRQVYMPVLGWHPFFGKLPRCLMDPVCTLAVTEQHYLAGQEVFAKGEEAQAGYFVCGGEVGYYVDVYNPVVLTVGNWIGEAVLWVQWTHCGCLVAKTCCELVVVDAQRFLAIMGEAAKHGFDLGRLRSYARSITDYFCAGEEPSDLWNDVHVVSAVAASALSPDGDMSCWDASKAMKRRTLRSQITGSLEGSLPWK